MAQYQHLNIYKASYDAFFKLVIAINHYPREFKFSIGEKIQNAAIDIIIEVYKANSAKNKAPHIQSIIDDVQLVYLLLRLSADLKILPREKYAEFIQIFDGISKQATGWQKSLD